ncbi:MAG: hypothetical protein IJD51_06030 [Clostridia bacterium]|nr:hypothetical protein [Clostridia bacterium]
MKRANRLLVLLLAAALLLTGAVLFAFAAEEDVSATSLDAPWQYVTSSGTTGTAATLSEAVTGAGSGTTVTLLCDTTEVTSANIADVNKALTIDLGGFTYRVSQSGQHVISVKTTGAFTLQNGTVVVSGNSAYGAANTSYTLLRADTSNTNVTVKNVTSYVGALFVDGWQGSATVNIVGGKHHIVFQATNLFGGGLVETRKNTTVNVTDTMVYVGPRSNLISSTMYNEGGTTKSSSYTFTNTTVVTSGGEGSLFVYANEYTTAKFDGCMLYGTINPTHNSYDANKSIGAIKDGAITMTGGTTIGTTVGQPFRDGLVSGESYRQIIENKTSFTLSSGSMYFDTASGTVADASFAIDSSATALSFITTTCYGDAADFGFSYDIGGVSYYTSSLNHALTYAESTVGVLKSTNIDISAEDYGVIRSRVTIDLGGGSMKLKDTSASSLRLGDGASITIKNGTVVKRGTKLSDPTAALFAIEGDGVSVTFENVNVFSGGLVKNNGGEGFVLTATGSSFNGINGSTGEWNSLIESDTAFTLKAENSSFVSDADTAILSVVASEVSSLSFKSSKLVSLDSAALIRYANDNLKITVNGGFVSGILAPALAEGDTAPAMGRGCVTVKAGTYFGDVASNTAGIVSISAKHVFNTVTKNDSVAYVSNTGAARTTIISYVWQIGTPAEGSAVSYTYGGATVVGTDLKSALSLVDEGGTVTLLKSMILTESAKGFAAFNKPMTLDLGGYTLAVIQEGEACFYANADVTIRNGSMRAVMNVNAPYPGRSYPLLCYGISKSNVTINLENVNTYGGSFIYTYNGTDHALNVVGGAHYAFNRGTGCDNGWLDVRCNFSFSATDALFVTSSESWLVSSLSFKDTDTADLAAEFVFEGCSILSDGGVSNVIGHANENSTFVFNGCDIYGALNPSVNSNDKNAGYGAIGAGGITLGEGTRINGAARLIGGGVIVAADGFILADRAYTDTVAVKEASYDSETGNFKLSGTTVVASYTKRVVDENDTLITVSFYAADGKTLVESFEVAAGTVITPPEYTLSMSNGWYSSQFAGWSTSVTGGTAATDFTAVEDVSYYPLHSEELYADFTAARYNLAFVGKVRNFLYIPEPPEGVELISVDDGNGTEFTGYKVKLSDGITYRMYMIGEVGAAELSEEITVSIVYSFSGEVHTQALYLSPLKYATAVLKDAVSDAPAFPESAHILVADLVRYSNSLNRIVTGSDDSALVALLEQYGALNSTLPSENDFTEYRANTTPLAGTIASVQLEVSSTEPRWIINIASGVDVESISVSMDGYLPTVTNGVSFGSLTYEAYANAAGTTFYTENIPMYNLDRLMTITVRLADGTERVGTYNLDAYYNGFSTTGESVEAIRTFLKAFRAFASSSSGYKYGNEIVREGGYLDFFDCEHTDLRAYSAGSGRFCYGCGTYLFFYSDYGAVADGVSDRAGTASGTNDFDAIYECHVSANNWSALGNRSAVVAVGGSHNRTTYYIGASTNLKTIPIRTDVLWSGANLIVDDRAVKQTVGDYYIPVFTVARGSESAMIDYSASVTTGISKGATDIGFAPGVPAIVHLMDRSIKRYIREGANADGGSYQAEVVIVDEYGNVSPSTPIQWDYPNGAYCKSDCATVDADANNTCDTCGTAIGKAMLVKAYPINDAPITISGLDREGNINFTWENVTDSTVNVLKYDQCQRTIQVERSNVTIRGIDRYFTEDDDNTTPRQAYAGIVDIGISNNVVISDMLLWQSLGHYVQNADGTNTTTSLGSYEFSAGNCTNVSWINCRMKNFFWSDGSITYRGMFGTNGLRNAYLKNCFLNSFDSHSGLYNAIIEDSTFDHINFIGGGDVYLKDVTIYTAQSYKMAIHLRQDYGATWNGNFYIDGLDIRYSSKFTGMSYIDLIRGYYTNWYFGYDTYLPRRVEASNVVISKYTRTSPECEFVGGTLVENIVSTNEIPLAIYGSLNTALKNDYDYSTVNANNEDPKHCTEEIYFSDNGTLTYKYPDHPFFKDMKIYIDGTEKTDWYTKRSSLKCTDTDGDKVCNTCFAAISCSAEHPTTGDTTASCSTCGATVSATSSGSDSGECVTGDTLITLADGTVKRIDELTGEELLLVFDHYTGEYTASPIVFIENDGVSDYTVVTLTFSDGGATRLIYEHGYFDLTLGEYVYVTPDNCLDFVGHEFAKSTGEGFEAVSLVSAEVETVEVGCYSLVTAYHYNFIVDGILSMPGGIDGIFNIFEYGDDLKYDEERMAADIAEYGLYTYSDFADYVTEEVYEIFLATYYKVAVGKGMITLDEIYAYIAKYL